MSLLLWLYQILEDRELEKEVGAVAEEGVKVKAVLRHLRQALDAPFEFPIQLDFWLQWLIFYYKF